MKKLQPYEVNMNRSLNSSIRSGQLGVIGVDADTFELVYFTECHYEGSYGRISNTFEYRSFGDDGILNKEVKNYFYRTIYDLTPDAKKKYTVNIVLGEK